MTKENKMVLGLIVLAYVFSYMFHIYWTDWASHYPQFFFHNQLMINNPDGYFYGSGAQKIVEHLHEYNPRLTGTYSYGTAVITAYLSKFFHISIDNLMLYLPALISSLVVIPIILIGKLYKNISWGFFAALIGSIGWSYYNRTTLKKFILQAYQNEFWVTYGKSGHLRHMIPMLFLFSIIVSLFSKILQLILYPLYFIVILFAYILKSKEYNPINLLVLLILTFTLHISYGFGSLVGLIKRFRRKK